MSEDLIAMLKEAMLPFDKDNDGTITTKELGPLLRSIGQYPNKTELRRMIDDIDTDGNGTVDLYQLVCLMTGKCWYGEVDTEEELRTAFRSFYPDGTGFIPVLELDLVFKKLEEVCDDEELVEMILDSFDEDILRGCESYTRDAFELWLREEFLPHRNKLRTGELPQQVAQQLQDVDLPVMLRVEVVRLSGDIVASITTNLAATVGVLLQETAKLTGMPAGRQSLLYAGSMLKPEASLAEAGVVDGATVTVIIRTEIRAEEVLLQFDPFLKMMMQK